MAFPQKEAFMLYQNRLMEVHRQLKIVAVQLNSKRVDEKRIQLTLQELEPLAHDSPVYSSVGKIFVRQPVTGCRGSLRESLDTIQSEISRLEKAKGSLEKQVKEAEDVILPFTKK